MKQKWPLFLGIVLLVFGILFRILQLDAGIYVPFFTIGGFLKIFYIVTLIRKGKYKPGWEISLLAFGLLIFFIGLILKNSFQHEHYLYWMIIGLTLKITFVFLFILKLKKSAYDYK